MITFPTLTDSKSRPSSPALRSATATLVQICLCHVNVAIDLPGYRRFPHCDGQSCAATSSANTLIGVRLPSRTSVVRKPP